MKGIYRLKDLDYVIFPDAKPPFLAINFIDPLMIKNGLKFYLPFGIKGMVKVGLVRYFVSLLLNFLPYKKADLIEGILNTFNRELVQKGCIFTNYYFISCERVVIQCVNKDYGVEGYVKCGKGDHISKMLQREVENIRFLSSFRFNYFNHPEVQDQFYLDNYFCIYLTPPEEHLIFSKWKDCSPILDLLLELFNTNKSPKTFNKSDIKEKIDKITDSRDVKSALDTFMEQYNGLSYTSGLVHGDFKPWNIYFEKKQNKFFIIDWEDMIYEGFPLYDLFTLHIFTHVSLNPDIKINEILKIIQKNLQCYKKYLKATDNLEGTEILWLVLFLINLLANESIWSRRGTIKDIKSREKLTMLLEFLVKKKGEF